MSELQRMMIQPWPANLRSSVKVLPPPPPQVPLPSFPTRKLDPWDVHLAEASDAVYANLNIAVQWFELEGCSNTRIFDNGFSQAVGYIRQGQRCLAIRGTQEAEDWWMDSLSFYCSSPPRHLGFQLGWKRLRSEVIDWLSTTSAVGGPITLTGHSLGGAVATIAALELVERGFEVNRVVVFGCPRVGNWEFVARYNTLGLSDRTKRYVHDQDGIAIVPPAVLYSHVCEPIRIPDYSILGSRIIPPPAPTVPAIQRINPLAKVSPPPAPAGLAPQRPATLFSLVAMIPSFAPIAWFFYQMVVADPDSRWNPERTTLGKNSLLGGYIIFALPMLAALTITKFEWFSTGLATLLQSIPWLFWLCAALGFLMAQQIGYQLLFAIPKWPRLALSLMLASLLAFWIPQLALLANILVLLSASGLVLIYFVLGGGADHPMEHYLRELGGRTTRTFCSVESAEGVEQFVAAQLSFARNHPQAAAKVADFLKNMKGK